MQNLTTSSVCGCELRTGFSRPFSLLQFAYSSLDIHPISGPECCRSSSCGAGVGVSAVKRRRKQETRGGESKRRKVEALGAALSSFGAVEVNAESQRHTAISAMTTNSIVRKTPMACTTWTSNKSQNLNQSRSADPGHVPLCLMTGHTVIRPLVCIDRGHIAANEGFLRRRCCASRVLSAQKKSLRKAYDLSLRRR